MKSFGPGTGILEAGVISILLGILVLSSSQHSFAAEVAGGNKNSKKEKVLAEMRTNRHLTSEQLKGRIGETFPEKLFVAENVRFGLVFDREAIELFEHGHGKMKWESLLGNAFKDSGTAFALGKEIGEIDFDIKSERECVEKTTEVEKRTPKKRFERWLKVDPKVIEHSDKARLDCAEKYLTHLTKRRPLVEAFFSNAKIPQAELIRRLEILSAEMLAE